MNKTHNYNIALLFTFDVLKHFTNPIRDKKMKTLKQDPMF